MKIHLLGALNGFGLEKDNEILGKALKSLGHEVTFSSFLRPKMADEEADLNIHMEAINEAYLENAPLNYFIPNPEWFIQDMDLLDKIDLMVCKTHEAERIFQELGYKTYYLGFTSEDCLQKNVKKDFRKLFHSKGLSNTKGSLELVRGWAQYITRNLPHLTMTTFDGVDLDGPSLKVFGTKVPLKDYRHLQNSCGIHLCPSHTEGFGHSIVEAMSVGAVVITLDAPPMNEFITRKECLVPITKTLLLQLATRYLYDVRQLIEIVENVVGWPEEKLMEIGQENRVAYVKIDTAFHERLEKLISRVH